MQSCFLFRRKQCVYIETGGVSESAEDLESDSPTAAYVKIWHLEVSQDGEDGHFNEGKIPIGFYQN